MARKWSDENLPGPLHFVTGIACRKASAFDHRESYRQFVEVCNGLKEGWPFKLIAYVLMPDRSHLIVNPMDGRIDELLSELKSLSTDRIVQAERHWVAEKESERSEVVHQVWQDFKAIPLGTGWMIWRQVNYIHSRPVKVGLARSASDYRWSSYRPFYFGADDPIRVDRDWWWPEDMSNAARRECEILK